MARRRTLDDMPDDQSAGPGFDLGGRGGFGGAGAEGSGDPSPDTLIERIAADVPGDTAFGGQTEGNQERPRDVFPGSEPRSPFAPAPPPAAAMGGVGGVDLSMLPQGVESPPQSVEAAPQSTAMAPYSPSPVSMQRGQAPASPSAVAPSTPARQPFSSPSAIFSAQGPRSIGGRSAGLTGGGLSMPGGPSGRPKPTEEMMQLLRSLGIGG